VGRPDRAHFHVTERPDDLPLVLRIECDDVAQLGWPAHKPRVVLRAPLGDLAGLNEGIRNMRDIFSATVSPNPKITQAVKRLSMDA
jgi:hypothetical protein